MKSQIQTALVGLLLLVIGAALILWIAYELWTSLTANVNESLAAAIATGSLVAMGAIWVKHTEHQHSVEAEFRERKVAVFNSFIDILNYAQNKNADQDLLTSKIKKFQDDLMFWSGPKVVKGFFDFKAHGRTLVSSPMKTVGELAVALENTGKLIMAMRKDAGLSNRGIVRHWTRRCSKATVMGAQYIVRDSEEFLTALEENPNTPVGELDEASGG